jgi:hypothetical protein
MLCIYYFGTISSGSGAENLPYVGRVTTSLEVDGLYRYVPSADNTTLIEETYQGTNLGNFDFSVIANDGHLFALSKTVVETQPGHMATNRTIQQLDASTDHLADDSIRYATKLYDIVNFAIVGDYIYYQGPGLNNWPGFFERMTLAGGKNTVLLARNDPDNFGNLYSVGDKLYRIDFNLKRSGQEIYINQIDLSTGHAVKKMAYHWQDSKEWNDPVFFTDDNTLYLATVSKKPMTDAGGDYEIKIDSLSSTEFDANQSFSLLGDFDAGNGAKAPTITVSADEGYILFGYRYIGQPVNCFLVDPTKQNAASAVSLPNNGQVLIAR